MNNSDISKLKVCHFISGDLWAGAESMAFNLLNHLRRHRDLCLEAIVLNEGRLAKQLRGIGIKVHVVDEQQHTFWEIISVIREVLRTAPPDLIHSHRYKENILAALSAGFNRRIKLIATQHGLPELSADKATRASRMISKTNFQLLAKFFTKTVAVSNDVKKALVNTYAFRDEVVEPIHNGIEIPAATFPKRQTGNFVIGSSGRLVPVKDYPLMIEIARSVSLAASDVDFELAGEGPERPVLEDIIQHYGLQEHFILKGHLDDMGEFYQGINVYLSTSIHEGIPMTILEALARGIPVIAPAVGGINEIITDGVEGFLLKSRNPADFREKCLLLKESPELHSEMSAAARNRAVQDFSAELMAENYYRLYWRTAAPFRQWQGAAVVDTA